VGVLSPDDLVQRDQRVDGKADDLAQDVPLRKSPPCCLDAGVGNAGIEERLRVVLVHDGVVAAVPQPLAVSPKHPVGDVVEGPAPEPPGVHSREKLNASQHLPGGLVRERGQEDPLRRCARLDEPGHPVRERPRLAAPRAGDDEHGPAVGRDDPVLLRVEFPFVVDRQRPSPSTTAYCTRTKHEYTIKNPPFIPLD